MQHRDSPASQIHTPFNWIVADAAARTALAALTAADINKVCLQQDTNAAFVLASIGPAVWNPVTGTDAAGVRGVLLAGLSLASSAAVAVGDSILGAIGKLQAQLGLKANISSATGILVLPAGTTAQRVTTLGPGLRWNNDRPGLEVFDGAVWGPVGVGGGSGSPSGPRNVLLNPEFLVDVPQRFASFSFFSGAYLCDKWRAIVAQNNRMSSQVVTDAPPSYSRSMKLTVTNSYASLVTDKFVIEQPVEGHLIPKLGLGTAGATYLVSQVWVKSSVAGTYAVSISNADGSRSVVGTMAVTNAWTQPVITVPGETSGTWLTGETQLGLLFRIDLGCGSNFNAPAAGAWNAAEYARISGCIRFVGQANGATFQLTGTQLEPGQIAYPAERLTPALTRLHTQRYARVNRQLLGVAVSATEVAVVQAFEEPMMNIGFTGLRSSTPTVHQPPFGTAFVGSGSSMAGFESRTQYGITSKINGFTGLTVGGAVSFDADQFYTGADF